MTFSNVYKTQDQKKLQTKNRQLSFFFNLRKASVVETILSNFYE